MNRTLRAAATLIATSALGIAGCATMSPPGELASARQAYARAQAGPARTNAPSELADAKRALDAAERSYSELNNKPEARDLAYIAERKAMFAEARASSVDANRSLAMSTSESERIKHERLMKTEKELAAAKARLTELHRSMDKLTSVTSHTFEVREEERGLVLTMPGGVLFEFGKADLLPNARKSLDEVADALKEHTFGGKIRIEGHTDSVGSDADNLALSRKRADAVRSHLVSHGVPEDVIESEGMGESTPVADNKSPEGRANNRRVELIIATPKQED